MLLFWHDILSIEIEELGKCDRQISGWNGNALDNIDEKWLIVERVILDILSIRDLRGVMQIQDRLIVFSELIRQHGHLSDMFMEQESLHKVLIQVRRIIYILQKQSEHIHQILLWKIECELVLVCILVIHDIMWRILINIVMLIVILLNIITIEIKFELQLIIMILQNL